MKRYKLLKDLPTFNAGDEFVLRDNGCLYLNKVDAVTGYLTGVGHWKNDVMAYHKRTLEQFPNILEDWFEEIEEPKEYWAIDQFGEPINVSGLSRLQLEKLHRLGNDFPSENATMKAIEKIKTWKRLKDKGLRFCGHDDKDRGQLGDIVIYAEMPTFEYDDLTRDELDLLFGGEE